MPYKKCFLTKINQPQRFLGGPHCVFFFVFSCCFASFGEKTELKSTTTLTGIHVWRSRISNSDLTLQQSLQIHYNSQLSFALKQNKSKQTNTHFDLRTTLMSFISKHSCMKYQDFNYVLTKLKKKFLKN